MSTNGNANHHEQYAATGPTTTESTPQIENSQSDLPKDEIGWYFVEQYYTTLSKNPNKLHVSLRIFLAVQWLGGLMVNCSFSTARSLSSSPVPRLRSPLSASTDL